VLPILTVAIEINHSVLLFANFFGWVFIPKFELKPTFIEMGALTSQHLEQLRSIVGKEHVFVDAETLEYFSYDHTENLRFLPEVVVKPASADEISSILKLCNQSLIPVTPRGAGTGLSGGALPHLGGVLLSTERLNQILEIDERNRGSCFIGGNVAENSGGPKAVKYGVVKDYVLNLEVVLPTGEIIWTGSNVIKNVTGYNLTQLIVGSEGTLGIVTKIVLKLIPLPTHDLLMLVPFKNLEQAGEAVSAIFRAGFTPSALELMEIDALRIVSEMVDNTAVPITDDTAAHLIIEVDGNDPDVLMRDMEAIGNLLTQYDIGEI